MIVKNKTLVTAGSTANLMVVNKVVNNKMARDYFLKRSQAV